jgi:hypothetical protein
MSADLRTTRMHLLSHSKNMVNAAQSHDWEAFEMLNTAWPEMLEHANEQFGSDLIDLQSELLENNQQIQASIEQAQTDLTKELQSNTQRFHRLQAYLK